MQMIHAHFGVTRVKRIKFALILPSFCNSSNPTGWKYKRANFPFSIIWCRSGVSVHFCPTPLPLGRQGRVGFGTYATRHPVSDLSRGYQCQLISCPYLHRYPMEIHFVHYKSKYGNLSHALSQHYQDSSAVTVLSILCEVSHSQNYN